MIPVTKPFLPPKEEVFSLLEDVWSRNWLTNNGPILSELELRLKDYLNVPHALLVNNGTIALQLAIKSLNLNGEILTTPFSYVATTSSILWENCSPIFVDIDKATLNIDPNKIESAITSNTQAILATHVFGNPCDIEAISKIATKYNIKVIYDAAHCFGSTYLGRSVFNYGDISVTSFHATKLYHTVEGGAVFTQDPHLLQHLASLRNFGHDGPVDFAAIGINGKNSEFHAAVGLVNLNYIDQILSKRKELCSEYDKLLRHEGVMRQEINPDSNINYSYYPVLFQDEGILEKIILELNKFEIYPRRYFYPSLNTVAIFNPNSCPISENISSRILCLPLYYDMDFIEVKYISRIILRTLKKIA